MAQGPIHYSSPVEWSHPLNRGLAGWWLTLPQWRGTIWRGLAGLSGRRSHDGTLTNFTAGGDHWGGSRGRRGGFGSLKFDGGDDYVIGSGLPASVPAYTVSAWVNLASTGTRNIWSAAYTGNWSTIFRFDTNVLTIYHLTSPTTFVSVSSGALNTGQWYHTAATWDGATVRLYVDGDPVGTPAATAVALDWSSGWRIGSQAFNGGELWAGSLDDIRVSTRVVSVAEIYLQSSRGHPDTLRRVRRVAYSVPAGGGTTYTRSLSEALGGSDAFARRADGNRLHSDNFGALEAYARVSDANRSLSDNVGALDAFARLSDALRSLSDSLGTQDAYARVSDALRALTDTLGLADAATLQLVTAGAFTIAVVEALGLVDAYSRIADANRTLSDTLALSDAFVRVSDAVRAYAESLGVADAEQSVVQWGRGLVDLVGVTDTFARQSDALRALTESLGTQDAYARVSDAYRVFTDTLGLADVVAAQLAGVLGPLIFEAALAFCAGAEMALAFTPGAEAGLSFTSGAEAALVEP